MPKIKTPLYDPRELQPIKSQNPLSSSPCPIITLQSERLTRWQRLVMIIRAVREENAN